MRRLPPGGVIRALATCFGLGYAPVVPGTFGSLGALPLWWLIGRLAPGSWLAQAAAALTLSAIALWVCRRAEALFGGHDDRRIVIDEVAGMLVAAIGLPARLPEIVAAFTAFRLLDAVKPWPIRWLDRNVRGALGIVIDDLAAGALACLAVHALRQYGGFGS